VHELIIRGGLVVDGTGAPARVADVAVSGGVIVEVGDVSGPAEVELDATGLVVTPGYVDTHTHYDGQATWDDRLAPSSWHGVTTAVLGNCGVGFAPVRPERRDWLIQLMEGVEDIPGTALHEGIEWSWETFPEYLDALEVLPRALDVAAHLPHGALRTYVMDERGADDKPATDEDMARMAELAEGAARAGAVGFSTNRLPSHRAKDGRSLPGTAAEDEELLAIARGLAAGGGGVVQSTSAEGIGEVEGGYREEVDRLTRISLETGLPTTMSLTQNEVRPELWREVLEWVHEANDAGAVLVPQVAGRPLSLLLGLSTRNQFEGRPSYDEIVDLPLAERVAAMGDADRRARILSEDPGTGLGAFITHLSQKLFPLSDPPSYEPAREDSIGLAAQRTGVSVDEACYDVYLRDGGRQLVLFTLDGYAHFDTEHIKTMLEDGTTMLGLADGGAHCSLICDASVYTSMLSYWVRDRGAGTVPIELVVSKMTSIPAALYGFDDRGALLPGRRADINVIDLDRLQLRAPEVAHDLPTGAARVVQRADGYVRTYVAGVAVTADDTDTGARPGRLVRRT
jgi:N-acyl-D-aspartate/D-glutamate deacylase